LQLRSVMATGAAVGHVLCSAQGPHPFKCGSEKWSVVECVSVIGGMEEVTRFGRIAEPSHESRNVDQRTHSSLDIIDQGWTK
jgi:hypothetical protein